MLVVPKAVERVTDVGARKEPTVAAAKVKRRIKDGGLSTTSKAKVTI